MGHLGREYNTVLKGPQTLRIIAEQRAHSTVKGSPFVELLNSSGSVQLHTV